MSETLTDKRQEHQADLLPGGALNVHGHGLAQALSAGASFITGGEVNGWKFWGVVHDGRWISLAVIRDSYLKTKSRISGGAALTRAPPAGRTGVARRPTRFSGLEPERAASLSLSTDGVVGFPPTLSLIPSERVEWS